MKYDVPDVFMAMRSLLLQLEEQILAENKENAKKPMQENNIIIGFGSTPNSTPKKKKRKR
jgi:hypothetical protein